MPKNSALLLAWSGLVLACSSGSNTTTIPECSIGAPSDLTAGPGENVGDSTGFREITECGHVTENVVLGSDLVGDSENCLVVQTDGVIIDGAGHSIMSGGYAVWIEGHSDVTVRNLISNSGINLYGSETNNCTIENSTLNGIFVSGGDDLKIRNNKLTYFGTLVSAGSDPSLRLEFTGNLVESDNTDPVAFYGTYSPPCPETNFLIEGNIFQNDSGPSDVPNVLRMSCSRKNIIRKNIMRGPNDAVGWYLRDDISDSLFEENTLWTNRGEALRIASGNVDKEPPSRNMFRNNIFRSDAGYASYIQTRPVDTTFEKNVFWGEQAWLTGGNNNIYDRNTFVGRGDEVATLTFRDTPGDTFVSNIFSGTGTYLFNFDGFGFDRYAGDFNVFSQTGSVEFKGSGSLTDWQIQSVEVGNPADANSIEADPSFVNAGDGDFRLSESSTVFGKGKGGEDPGAYPASCSP